MADEAKQQPRKITITVELECTSDPWNRKLFWGITDVGMVKDPETKQTLMNVGNMLDGGTVIDLMTKPFFETWILSGKDVVEAFWKAYQEAEKEKP